MKMSIGYVTVLLGKIGIVTEEAAVGESIASLAGILGLAMRFQKTGWLKHEIIRLTGMASVTPDNETCHARSPHLNPLGKTTSHSTRLQTTAAKSLVIPQAGEEANESLREFYVTAIMPQAGCRSIAGICNRRFAASRKITVGKTYVHQVLQQHDYEIKILRRNLKHAKPKNVPRNLIWGIDLTGKTDTNGKLHALFGILDHGSRALLYLQALHDKTSHTLLACLIEITRIHGKPKVIRTDNEAIFTSRKFRRGLKLLGIRHQLTDPGCPWQNGRIERLFGTLKQKLDQWQVPDFAQLSRDLDTFRHWYNHIRPHQNLDGKTQLKGSASEVSPQNPVAFQ
jgi:transposase InsO family protein